MLRFLLFLRSRCASRVRVILDGNVGLGLFDIEIKLLLLYIFVSLVQQINLIICPYQVFPIETERQKPH